MIELSAVLGRTKRAATLPSLRQRTAVLYYAARHRRALNVKKLAIEVWPISLRVLLYLVAIHDKRIIIRSDELATTFVSLRREMQAGREGNRAPLIVSPDYTTRSTIRGGWRSARRWRWHWRPGRPMRGRRSTSARSVPRRSATEKCSSCKVRARLEMLSSIDACTASLRQKTLIVGIMRLQWNYGTRRVVRRNWLLGGQRQTSVQRRPDRKPGRPPTYR
jgi:hypothetical protein